MTETRKLRVFLCHASQDKPIVRELYRRLNAEGWIDPWLDEEKLLPGQDWDMEIEKAVEATDAVIVCLSTNSVSKEGYIQKELKFVLDIALEKPEGKVFVIPLRLDGCGIPRRLRSLHYVDYFPPERISISYKKLCDSLRSETSDVENITSKNNKDINSIRDLERSQTQSTRIEAIQELQHDLIIELREIDKLVDFLIEKIDSHLLLPSFGVEFEKWFTFANEESGKWFSIKSMILMYENKSSETLVETNIENNEFYEFPKLKRQLIKTMPPVLRKIVARFQISPYGLFYLSRLGDSNLFFLAIANLAYKIPFDSPETLYSYAELLTRQKYESDFEHFVEPNKEDINGMFYVLLRETKENLRILIDNLRVSLNNTSL